MSEHAVQQAQDNAVRAYIQQGAGTSAWPFGRARAPSRVSRTRAIDDAEFARLKTKVLA
jgi:hypothetical protein